MVFEIHLALPCAFEIIGSATKLGQAAANLPAQLRQATRTKKYQRRAEDQQQLGVSD